MKKMGVGILLLAAGCGGSGCALIPKMMVSEKRDVYTYEHPFEIESPTFRRSAEALGSPMVGGNSVVLLKNGDEIFPAMIRDIGEAKRTVNLESYIFLSDEAGRRIADALIAAAKRGVHVHLLVDSYGSSLKGLAKELKDAGVNVRKYRPLKLITIYKMAQRSHRKILVVDGRVAYTGGLGIAKPWLGDARGPKEWRDTEVRAEGPVAAQMQAVFSEDWVFTTGEILAGDDYYPALAPAGSITAQAVKASRGDASSLAKMLYYVAIKSAKKTVFIANAYFLPDKQVRRVLLGAVKRGVDVEIMVPGRYIDVPMVRTASWHHYGELLRGGVKIYEYKPTMMHHKTIVIDGIYSTVGSINFDDRSMNRNAEASLSVYDRGFSEQMEAMFQQDKKKCDEITLAVWKDRGAAKRAAELVSWLWEPYY